ncbi:Holliday junction resolvase RecU [Candidatus Mycoplasma mahonii]|uniref:Holliday junction resolvase RecU n=1 Tax=Candidatus Mycoplasma mahonii TaxID=3004105 RepID=UPI0026F27AD9|nr:Holliday junction resolvase RecU [Candidatus Mycoplasma mahonii]WKX02622.1 Holliday junction resolvase RecU [Candidatus Mycoplasma mahonii]
MKNRGMMLESLINKTIIMYKRESICIFHKKHIPIKFSGIEKHHNKLKVKNGFVSSKSTADYYGIYQSVFVAFEAKSTINDNLPLSNIKSHQSDYIKTILEHGGCAFYIVGYTLYNEYFIVEQKLIDSLERKSLTIEKARSTCYELKLEYPGILDFVGYITKII